VKPPNNLFVRLRILIPFGIGQPPARVTQILKPVPDLPPFQAETPVKHKIRCTLLSLILLKA
jgi:hypothetical protein